MTRAAARSARRPGLAWARDGLVAGVDEAGRGPLAGPVTAAAVILAPGTRIRGVRDSKVIPQAERERLADTIRTRAIAWSVAWADAAEIDALDILRATHLAMRRSLLGLAVRPQAVRIDGNQCPSHLGLGLACEFDAVIGGDGSVAAIAAASILAKVARDEVMRSYDRLYPGYGFASHKGYATREHLEALLGRGVTPIHRRSFAPVQCVLARGSAAELLALVDATHCD